MDRNTIAELAGDIDGVDTESIDDWDVLDRFDPAMQRWWVQQFASFIPENEGFFTPPQKQAIPLIDQGENTLICAPTGLGKTLASFSAILNELFKRGRANALENTVYCLYISPLKSLANDIHRNLEVPLEAITDSLEERGADIGEIRHAIRHGDTDSADRQRMLDETPHILNTTPESLAIMLNSPKFKEKLRSVKYVIVDEIHALAESKRGTHLSVSLERLENMTHSSPVRIGCSATVEPVELMAEFLVGRSTPDGEARPYEVVDTRFVRDYDIRLECPAADLIHTENAVIQDRFYRQLHEYIQAHETTLVFTNTRAGAERTLHNLRVRFPDWYNEENSGCHHGSLGKSTRKRIEERLKTGGIDVVTSSTSLELGIDMPTLDLVVQVGSPKSVAALLQRIGRAGHRIGETVEGRVFALDRDELIECTVMLKKAEDGFIDRVFIPENCQDVAAQHVYGMAINAVRREEAVFDTLRRAHPYRNYSRAAFDQLIRYLALDYDGLEERNVYAKIWRDTNDPPNGEYHYDEHPVGEPLIGKRGRLARVIYMTNIGTIPDSFSCDVFTRGDNEWVGDLDEEYLNTLQKGDVFVLGGDRFKYQYRRGTKVYVDPTGDRPTVPSWFSERLPLSYDLGCEILGFHGDLLDRLTTGPQAVRDWLSDYPIDGNSRSALARMFDEQVRYAGPDSVSTDELLAIETHVDADAGRRYYYVHSNYGRRFNDGLSRLLAYLCTHRTNTNVGVAVADHGFVLSMPFNRSVAITELIQTIDPGEIRSNLRSALRGTELLKRYFRINATRSLLVLREYKGHEKSAAKQQVDSEMLLGAIENFDEFAVLEETYREIMEDKLDVERIIGVVERIIAGDITVSQQTVPSPSPRAFGLATLTASDVVLAEDESKVLKEFHAFVESVIEEQATPIPDEDD